eukprot:2187827-Rhodomonas_salina.2
MMVVSSMQSRSSPPVKHAAQEDRSDSDGIAVGGVGVTGKLCGLHTSPLCTAPKCSSCSESSE